MQHIKKIKEIKYSSQVISASYHKSTCILCAHFLVYKWTVCFSGCVCVCVRVWRCVVVCGGGVVGCGGGVVVCGGGVVVCGGVWWGVEVV